jgi:hypothetical protein
MLHAPLYILGAANPATSLPIAVTTIAHTVDWNQVNAFENTANLLVDQTVAKFSHEGKQLLTKTACGAALITSLYCGTKCYNQIVKYYNPIVKYPPKDEAKYSQTKEAIKNRHWWYGIGWGICSSLSLGAALYLYMYQWDIPFAPHMATITPTIPLL